MKNVKRNLSYVGAGLLCFIVIFNSILFAIKGPEEGLKYMESFSEVFKIISLFFTGG